MKFLWVFDYDAILTIPLVSGVLWSWGGSGPKYLRRLGVGAFLALTGLSLGLPWYLAWLLPSIFLVTTSLPYGDDIRGNLGIVYYPFLFLLGVLYGLGLFPLCIHFGSWITLVIGSVGLGLLFSLLTFASQSEAFRNVVSWKAVEIITGFFLGLIAYKLYS